MKPGLRRHVLAVYKDEHENVHYAICCECKARLTSPFERHPAAACVLRKAGFDWRKVLSDEAQYLLAMARFQAQRRAQEVEE